MYLYLHSDTGRRWSHCGIMYLSRSLLPVLGEQLSKIWTRSLTPSHLSMPGYLQIGVNCDTLTSGLHFRRSRRATGIVKSRLAGGGHCWDGGDRQDRTNQRSRISIETGPGTKGLSRPRGSHIPCDVTPILRRFGRLARCDRRKRIEGMTRNGDIYKVKHHAYKNMGPNAAPPPKFRTGRR